MTELAPDWSEHEGRAGELVASLVPWTRPYRVGSREVTVSVQWLDQLFSQQPEIAGGGLLLLVRRCRDERLSVWEPSGSLHTSRDRWTVSRRDAVVAASLVRDVPDTEEAAWALKLVQIMLRRTIGAENPTNDEADVIRALIASVRTRTQLATRDRNQLRASLLNLVAHAIDAAAPVDTSALVAGDLWSQLVIADLQVLESRAVDVSLLLAHLAASSGSKPSAKWLAEAQRLVARPGVAPVLRALVDRLVDADRTFWELPTPTEATILDDGNVDVVRAAIWATVGLRDDWVVPTLRDLAKRMLHVGLLIGWLSWEKVPNACLVALGRRGTPESVVAIRDIAAATKHSGFRKRAAAALEVAGEASGLTAGQVVERAIPTGGLDPTGTVTLSVGEHVARATLDDTAQLNVEWKTTDGWAPKAPTDMPNPELNAIKRAVKELRDTISAERRRLEALFATGRSWEFDEWSRYYLAHPITGRFTRRLIWRFEHNGSVVAGVPDGAVLHTVDGDVAMPARGSVQLWHPANVPTDEVQAWRAWLFEHRRPQPFKQAFREVYLLTPAERETATYSNRFAAHLVRYQQLFMLCKERGWATNYLGNHEGGYEGCARREFRDAGVTAAFDHGLVDSPEGAMRVYLSLTDRVWFYRSKDRGRAPLPLADVPPLVFSEAMRDVDLFVSATSISMDPEWADRGDEPGGVYWRRASIDALAGLAQVRRDALARILPTLRIADRVELDDRFVHVRGVVGSYKVHIGSANVFAGPDDRFVCIVARKVRSAPMLPFEGDEVLSVIISKVLQLAADDKITDSTILEQLRRRA